MIEVKIHSEYILLGQFLKFAGIISNGGQAKAFLFENDIKVNGIDEKRRGKKLYNGDLIQVLSKKYLIKSE